ncbi:PadR family transcriptional regulator [Paenibacillus segetis]|uniref:PadR family transcriptional regulator n=1 Tax=Paenibacillus segetis TaxID=1325360 RepID=A0ABQ1YM00_9BACL|nr:PadR family transcriptional regulator [Paenibacillus segetis]GGH30882.1 PadR family transcriptional regulator [Paenibacillus segetis]
MNTEMLKGTIDLLILSVLKEKASYGYEISRTIKLKTQGEFEIQEATLYLALKRLEKHDAISSFWGDETHGGKRKYYSITEEGVQLLNRDIQDWVNTTNIVNRFIQSPKEHVT